MANNFSSNLGLDQLPNVEDEKVYGDMLRVFNAINILGQNLDTYTGIQSPDQSTWSSITPQQSLLVGNQCTIYVTTSVALTNGQLVGLNSSGQCVLANSGTILAIGVCIGNFAAGATAQILLFGLNGAVTGLVPGTHYYLATTGSFTSTAPTSGSRQPIGYAIQATLMWFSPAMMFI